MADLKIITKVTPGDTLYQEQPGNPSEFFGEQSNDLQLNNVNDFSTASGIEKLKQDINKILLTELGKNSTFEIYGTQLQSLVGGKSDITELQARVRDNVQGALEVLEFLNRENTNDDEVPETFESLSVQQLEIGRFEVQVSVLSRSGKRISSDPIILQ